MSRRRNRPNLPEETLRRARRAAGLPTPEAESETPAAMPASEDPAEHSRAARRAARRRQRLDDANKTTRNTRNDAAPDAAAIAERLAAPTQQVSEGELRTTYAHVLRDLRSMGLLAAFLLGVLVFLALVL